MTVVTTPIGGALFLDLGSAGSWGFAIGLSKHSSVGQTGTLDRPRGCAASSTKRRAVNRWRLESIPFAPPRRRGPRKYKPAAQSPQALKVQSTPLRRPPRSSDDEVALSPVCPRLAAISHDPQPYETTGRGAFWIGRAPRRPLSTAHLSVGEWRSRPAAKCRLCRLCPRSASCPVSLPATASHIPNASANLLMHTEAVLNGSRCIVRNA